MPVGPVRLQTDSEDGQFLVSDYRSDDHFGTSPANSSSAAMSRSGSFGGSSGGLHVTSRVLRHVYVAVVVGVVQFMSGQRDLLGVDTPVPSGNIVGLTGPDLITFLPKSGLLVDRLSLVSGGQSGSAPVLPLAGLAVWHGAPVISVAVEPASAANPEDVYRLERGLKLLDRADPCAEVSPFGASYSVHYSKLDKKCVEFIVKHWAKFFILRVDLGTKQSLHFISLAGVSDSKT